jgi:Tol biopolymer transport system component
VISQSVWISDDEVLYFQAESVAGNGVGTSPSRAYRQNLQTGKVFPVFWAPATGISLDVLPDGRVVFDAFSGRQNLREYPLDRKSPPRWITRGNINDRQPVFSQEGEWVVYSSNRSGNLDLWSVSTKTGVQKSLTDDKAEDWDPGISPDGQHLLWSSNRSGAFEIWMANVDGSAARQVTQDGVDAENPTQTRDGEWIVYTSANPKHSGVWKIHPDGTGATCLIQGTRFGLPEVSPDGQYVLYNITGEAGSVELRVASVKDGVDMGFQVNLELLKKSSTSMGRGRWLPDGHRIIFTGQDAKGLDGIFIQDFVPGKDTLATRKPLAGFDPDWITESLGLSRDGTRLVLSESERMFSLMVAEGVPGLPTRRKVTQ